jgi:hypothetical protein
MRAAHRLAEEIHGGERPAQVQPRLAGADVGEAGRETIRRLVVPRRRQVRGDVDAGVGQRRGIDAGGAGDARHVARQRRFDRRDGGGGAGAGDGREVQRDRGIEGLRRIGQGRRERLRREGAGLPGGIGQGGRRRSVAAQGGDAGELAEGTSDGVGRGKSVPKDQTGSGGGRSALARAAS